jgi:hypothetical protein
MPRKPAPPKKPAKQRTKRPAVAPSDDPKVIQRICDLLSEGVPLRQILRENPGMPGPTVFYARLDPKSDQYSASTAELIARARVMGHDALAEECLQIANTPLEGSEITEDDKGTSVKRGDMLGHRKLQIETRLKLLAKWDPKRYGDKLAVGGADDLPPLKTVSDGDLLARIAALQAKVNGNQG